MDRNAFDCKIGQREEIRSLPFPYGWSLWMDTPQIVSHFQFSLRWGAEHAGEVCRVAQWLPSCEMTRDGRCDAQYVRARIIADLCFGQEEAGKEKRHASESRHRIGTE